MCDDYSWGPGTVNIAQKEGAIFLSHSCGHISKLTKIINDFWCCRTRKEKNVSLNVYALKFKFTPHDSFL